MHFMLIMKMWIRKAKQKREERYVKTKHTDFDFHKD